MPETVLVTSAIVSVMVTLPAAKPVFVSVVVPRPSDTAAILKDGYAFITAASSSPVLLAEPSSST